MTNLIRTEWLKIRKYRAFWWMALIVLLSYPAINWFFYYFYKQELLNRSGEVGMFIKSLGNPFAFPEIWHSAAYFSSYFVFIPAIVVIMFITNEYTYKTHRQNIIDGWSRGEFMMSKLIDVFLISLLVTLAYVVIALVIGNLNIDYKSGDMMEKWRYIPLFLLQTFSQLSIAFLIALLTRKAFIALGIFFFYFLAESIGSGFLRAYGHRDIAQFLPLEVSDMIIPVPPFLGALNQDKTWYPGILAAVNPHIIYTLILTTLIWALCFWINKRKDL